MNRWIRFIVSSTLFCCGGFIYKTQVMGKRGIDALPGMTIVSAYLETVSITNIIYIASTSDYCLMACILPNCLWMRD
ncbi:hypothetical protein RchiOBHm_Chr2g0136281 [Rosa chinensis]|uniref:Uncharacterized protein n=1 Tax=Rosa chinensis TaxID=74649 RepID=A0A2P6RWB3_ROSCH|nr:hypothetical protein RchiOBHm_Chr2g0136281 [Rosa chinensis]